MQNVVGIRLKPAGRVYYFDPNGIELKTGDLVVIDSEKGPCIGEVVRESYEVDADQSIRKVNRKVSEEDLKRVEDNKVLKKEAFQYCLEKINESGMPMKLVETELSFDGSKAIFYFTSEGRVDFRELVKDLAAKFKIRIEMKQIGVRDEARLIGGFGCCGRALCCETFIKDFEPVSIRMAKKQELALNPTKISGVCGRLMCCLVFEYDIYDEIKKDTSQLRSSEKSASAVESAASVPPSPEKIRPSPPAVGIRTSAKTNEAQTSKGSAEERAPSKRRRRRRRKRKKSEGEDNSDK